MLNRLICLILGYFIGAIIQTGFWIGKFNHIDIRDYGSGNAGTTNTMRTLGKKAGFITYFMDAFKSCITAIIIHFIYGSNSDISEIMADLELSLDITFRSTLDLKVEKVLLLHQD